MALCAARLSGISTKPKPRERPVSTVVDNPARFPLSIRRKELAEVILRGGKREIAHKDIHVRVL